MESQHKAVVFLNGKFIIYYPPGSATGYSVKRVLAVSFVCFLVWSVAIAAAVSTVRLFF